MTTNPLHELIREAASARIQGRALSEEEAHRAAARLAEVFAGLSSTRPRWDLWDRFEASASSRDPEGWRRLGALVASADEPVVLLVHHADRWHGFSLRRAADVERLLGECPGFEVYAVSPAFDRAACFNHHDDVVVARPLRSTGPDETQQAAPLRP